MELGRKFYGPIGQKIVQFFFLQLVAIRAGAVDQKSILLHYLSHFAFNNPS